MNGLLEILLYSLIAALFIATLFLLITSAARRHLRLRMFRDLDEAREFYRGRIREALTSGTLTAKWDLLRHPPGSPKWKAIQGILLYHIEDEGHFSVISNLLHSLGYISHYERLTRRVDLIQQAYAITMLGKMKSRRSIDLLLPLLDKDETEIVTVTIRALSKIGSGRALKGILLKIPDLMKTSRITRKALVTSLVQFGEGGVTRLLDFYRENPHPWIRSIVLEVLGHLGSVKSLDVAIQGFKDPHPEVRAKALKLISQLGKNISLDTTLLYPLLGDPSWFVRLHATRALGDLEAHASAPLLKKMLIDTSWQVRNAAASSLSRLGNRGVEAFREIMGKEDSYAKESICEELGKTGMVHRLIEELGSYEEGKSQAARDIIGGMCSLNFRTQCEAYASLGKDRKIREELTLLLGEGM